MKILAVDLGDVRTGLAVCDETETLSSPGGVICERNSEKLIEKLKAFIIENNIKEVIIGNPINMNGTEGPASEKCAQLAEKLEQTVDVPVILWDERSTTVLAHNLLSEADVKGKKRKQIIDSAAAAVILENYLTYKKNKKNKK